MSPAKSGGAAYAACAETPSEVGSNSPSSSSSSSLFYRHEFHELHRVAEEDHKCYLDSAHEVSQLESCLDAIEVALEASGRETAAAQVVAADVQT